MAPDVATREEGRRMKIMIGLPPEAAFTREFLVSASSPGDDWPSDPNVSEKADSSTAQGLMEPSGSATDSIPSWWNILVSSDLRRLRALPENWDSYQSPKIDGACIAIAGAVLQSISDQDSPIAPVPIPSIVPVGGGGVQMEWQYGGRELELEIEPGSQDVFFLKVWQDGTDVEGHYHFSLDEKTRGLLSWLLNG